ncbi:MAG: DUF3604 domain-containing protein [Candidatus Latescibacterota bacterium]|nr:MAG: DUF3604 domain-containing protein [Candidatus Latescibacterota bacterium]
MKPIGLVAFALVICAFVAAPAPAQQQQAGEMTLDKEEAAKHFLKRGYSPYADRGFPTHVYWGDTHLHTANSPDAFAFGNRLTPEDAYRFARGETVTSASGQRVQLSRPLDFLVVADHGVAMGAVMELYKGHPDLMKDPQLKRWHDMMNDSPEKGVEAAGEMISAGSQGKLPPAIFDRKIARSAWTAYTETAEQYNDPGRFTALIGYEWTSLIKGNNLHRVLVFRGDKSRADQILPFTFADSPDPEKLWEFMANYEKNTGDFVLAIPHNGNLSNGMMFAMETVSGKSFNRKYAETRANWEPVYEVTQIKGDGEAHPYLSPNDEFADYETWDAGNLDLSQEKSDEMLQYEYAREALKNGLLLESKVGVNPFKLGMIGSTDSHTALATAAEENFFGKHTGKEPSNHRWNSPVLATPERDVMGWEQASSGLAAVWATENTREAIWDAFNRREVYATTGSRILVRFWGGWEFEPTDAMSRLPGEIGYAKGVPMGGDLSAAPQGESPTFLVAALKDPLSGNLDRIQIIKGWLDGGKTYEKVYDVVWSDADRRKPGTDGKLPAVGNTVDVANATWTNTIGDPELITVWEDPDFDPAQPAFYYVRVIEIPTPRWTAYDAKRFGIKMSADVPMTTQERAYTSPIWYTP